MSPVLCVVGDLVTDVVVELDGEIVAGTDTPARIHRRRGGAAANLAVTAVRIGADVRLLGNVGADPDGDTLAEEMAACGVDARLTRGGRTGTVVVLVDTTGERTMLTDRGSSHELGGVDETVLDDADALYLTGYSLLADPARTTVTGLAAVASARGVAVHVDVASAGSVAALGVDEFVDRLGAVRPDVVHLNADEGRLLSGVVALRDIAPLVVVHAGADPAIVHRGPQTEGVPALDIGPVRDSTGAGDAFVAGWLVASASGADALDATRSAHAAAAAHLRRRTDHDARR